MTLVVAGEGKHAELQKCPYCTNRFHPEFIDAHMRACNATRQCKDCLKYGAPTSVQPPSRANHTPSRPQALPDTPHGTPPR